MTDDALSVTVTVEGGGDLSEWEQRVVSSYEDTIETFIRKTRNYGNSFVTSAKVESILATGSVDEDAISKIASRQIFVRGLLDKLSRFYQLEFEDEDDRVDESIEDTLLDMGNYAVMLASIHRKYSNDTSDDTTPGSNIGE